MRKKLLTKTYLRGVTAYDLILVINDNNDYYKCIKTINKINEPFIIEDGTCLINKGYKIVEIIPKKENYSVRIYINENSEILQYYIDITNGSGIDEESNVPYYDDLYLDLIYANGKTEKLDEDELENALKEGKISETEYDKAINTCEKLIKEINRNQNVYIDLSADELLAIK